MTMDAPTNSPTAVAGATPFSLSVGGRTLYVRPPTPEEYDEAHFIEDIALQEVLQRPELQSKKQMPVSEDETRRLQLAAEISRTEAEALSGDPDKQDELQVLNARIAYYEEAVTRRTLADELASQYASLIRDRWLAARLLTFEDGSQVFDTKDAQRFEKQWAAFPASVKDRARPLIWMLLQRVENAPLPWEV
jgi:hypothetical protein